MFSCWIIAALMRCRSLVSASAASSWPSLRRRACSAHAALTFQQQFGLLALCDIHEHVDAADQIARFIEQRRGVRFEPDAGAVRPLGDCFGAADGPPFRKRDRHRALVVRHRPAVRVEQLPGDAPMIGTEQGRAAGERDAGRVEVGDAAFRVSRVDCGGQSVDDLARATRRELFNALTAPGRD